MKHRRSGGANDTCTYSCRSFAIASTVALSGGSAMRVDSYTRMRSDASSSSSMMLRRAARSSKVVVKQFTIPSRIGRVVHERGVLRLRGNPCRETLVVALHTLDQVVRVSEFSVCITHLDDASREEHADA